MKREEEKIISFARHLALNLRVLVFKKTKEHEKENHKSEASLCFVHSSSSCYFQENQLRVSHG